MLTPPKYTTPSMGRGAEHSAPLKVKYQRLQQFLQPWTLRVPVQATWRDVSEKFLVNTQSCITNKNKKDMKRNI